MQALDDPFHLAHAVLASPIQDFFAQFGFALSGKDVLWLYCAALGLVFGLYFRFKANRLKRHGQMATGEVVGFKKVPKNPEAPVIAFHDHTGTLREFTSGHGTDTLTNRVGQRLDVVFDPARPARACEAHRLGAANRELLIFSGLAVLALVFVFVV